MNLKRNIMEQLKKAKNMCRLVLVLLFLHTTVYAQRGLGTNTPHTSAILELQSTTKGFLMPRLTFSEINSIPDPAEGLMVYCTDEKTIFIRDDGAWRMYYRRDQIENHHFITVDANGNMGIGTSSPVGKMAIITGDATSPNDEIGNVLAWDETFVTIGSASNSDAGNLGLGYSNDHGSVLLSLSPGAAWKDMSYVAEQHIFKRGSNEHMRIDSSGKVIIKGDLQVDGTLNNTLSSATIGSETIESDNIKDGTIMNVDVNAAADIAGSKINPDFGAQNLTTTGNISAADITSTGDIILGGGVDDTADGNKGIDINKDGYIQIQRSDATSTAGTALSVYHGMERTIRFRLGGSAEFMGNVGIGMSAPSVPLTVASSNGGNNIRMLGRSSDGFASIGWRDATDSMNNGQIGVSNSKNMLFYTNDAEHMRIESSGKVIIEGDLEVKGTLNNNLSSATIGTGTIESDNIKDGTIMNVDFNAAAAIAGSKINPDFGGQDILTTGNLGIGTTQPRHKLDVFTGGSTHFQTYTYGAEVAVGTENRDTGAWARSLRFRSIGTDASDYAASIGAYNIGPAGGYLFLNSQFNITQQDTVGYLTSQFRLHTNGNVTLTGTLTHNSSDRRLKDNLTVISDAIKKVNTLSGYEYDWKAPAPLTGHDVGLIAQEVQAVYPEAVKPAPFDRMVNADGQEVSKSGKNYLTIQYEKLVPLLVQAIKEQQQQIEALHKEIEKIKKQ